MPPSSNSFLAYRSGGRPRGPRKPVLEIAGIGLALIVCLMLIGGAVAVLFGSAWRAQYVVDIGSTRPGKYLSTAHFQLVAQGVGRDGGTRMWRGYVICDAMEEPGCIGFDFANMTCEINSYQGQKLGRLPLTRGAMLSYVLRAGYAPGDVEAGAVADALWDEVQWLKDGPRGPRAGSALAVRPGAFEYRPTEDRFLMIRLAPMTGAETRMGLPWYTPWVLPVWLLAWWQSARVLLRRYRRRLRAFEA